MGWPFWDSPCVPIVCSRQAGSLFEVLATLPLENTPILEKVQKDKEEKCRKGN